MDKVFPSHQKVRCPKQGCGKEVRKDRLKSHLLSLHGETSYQIPGQSKLSDMFNKKQGAPITSTNLLASEVQENENEIMEDQSSIISELRHLKAVQERRSLSTTNNDIPNKNTLPTPEPAIQYGIPTTESFQKFFSAHTQSTETANKENVDYENSRNLEDLDLDILKKIGIPNTSTSTMERGTSCILPTTENQLTNASTSFGEQHDLEEQHNLGEAEASEADDMSVCESTSSRKKGIVKSFLSKFSFKKRKRTGSIFGSTTSVGEGNAAVNGKLLSIDSNVQEINATVNGLVDTIKSLDLAKRNPPEETTRNRNQQILDAKKVLVRASKSINQLRGIIPEILFLEQEAKVECQICTESDTSILKPIGVLSYNFEVGTDFAKTNAPREFLNLKKKLVSHLESNHHIECSKESELKSENSKKLINRNYKVGMTLGLQAYQILKTGQSSLKFETDIATLSAHGIDVGNINHGRKFCAEFGKSVSEVLQARLKTILHEPIPATGRPVPIAIMCDKLTPNRMTMQIVAIHGFIGSKFQSLVAGVPALSGNDGLSVTRCIRKGLESLEFSQDGLASRLVGGAFDGEYFNLNIPKHLSNTLLVSEEQAEWYSYQWDPAHVLELAEKDARKNTQSVKNTFTSVNNVSKSFAHGKSFRELIEEAAQTDEKARAPGHFSDTRFATYSSIVLKKFMHNYKFYYKVLNRNQDDDLDRIDNAHFMFSLGALIDTYDVIGNLSNSLQKPEMPHWVAKNVCSKHVEKLNAMHNVLNSKDLDISTITESGLFPHLSKIVTQVSDSGEYEGCAVITKQHSTHLTRHQNTQDEFLTDKYSQALISAATSVGKFLNKFERNFTNRLEVEEDRNLVLKYVDNLFDVKSIVKRENDECDISETLEKYTSLAKQVGSLPETVKFDSIKEQYCIMATRIKEIAPMYKISNERDDYMNVEATSSVNSDSFNDIKIYSTILESERLGKFKAFC